MSKKRKAPDAALDMTPMIDVVFQLIIFFITTVDMESKALETKVRMAMAPNGPVEEQKDPRTVIVDVEKDGTIKIQQTPLSEGQLLTVMKKAVAPYMATMTHPAGMSSACELWTASGLILTSVSLISFQSIS